MFKPGQRVTTATGNLTGTVIEQIGDVVELEWDEDTDGGPYLDEVHHTLIHPEQPPHAPHGASPSR